MCDQTINKTDSFSIEEIFDDGDITEATKETLRQLSNIDFENDDFLLVETQRVPSSIRNDDGDDRNDIGTQPRQHDNHAIDETRDDKEEEGEEEERGAKAGDNEVAVTSQLQLQPRRRHQPRRRRRRQPQHQPQQQQNHPNRVWTRQEKEQLVLYHPKFLSVLQLAKEINEITKRLRRSPAASPDAIQEPVNIEQRRHLIQYIAQRYLPTRGMIRLPQLALGAIPELDCWIQESSTFLQHQLDVLNTETCRIERETKRRVAIFYRSRAVARAAARPVKKGADLDGMVHTTQNDRNCCGDNGVVDGIVMAHHHHQQRQLHERPMSVEPSRPCKRRRRITDDSEHSVGMEQPSLKEHDGDDDLPELFNFCVSDEEVKEACFLDLQSCSWENED